MEILTSSIDRENNTVTITILGCDKYYNSNTLTTTKTRVYLTDGEMPDDEVTTITKELTEVDKNSEEFAITVEQARAKDIKNVGVIYKLTLKDYNELSGATKVIIDAGTIKDNSGNENLETEIPAGNTTWTEEGDNAENPRYPAFRNDIVDFINPVIKYKYSNVEGAVNPNIDYVAKTLTVKFTVTDKYLLESTIIKADGTLNTDAVRIRVAGEDITEQLHTSITSADITQGKEYTLVVSNFELAYNAANGYQDYSGEVQLDFIEGKIDDTSGNKNVATTITIDTDDGDDTDNPIIVDVIDPLIEKTEESYSVKNSQNSISRDLNTETGDVYIKLRATDKYLDLAKITGNSQDINKLTSDIKVMIQRPGSTEKEEVTTISKTATRTATQPTYVEYQIKLSNFERNEGTTSIIIPQGVIVDKSGNGNKETEIFVGNKTWLENGDNAANPEYTAFRNSIVDFTRPTWEYSTSSITRNRNEETGTVTIKLLGRDTYYLKDTLTPNNIKVYVANSENPDTPITTITKTLTKITNESELNGADTGYTLTLGNFGKYDGKVTIKIDSDTIKDTSGIGNKETDIEVGNPNWVETDINDDSTNPKYTAFRNSIVDFIKPTVTYQYAENVNPVLDRENSKVSISFNATDTNFLESLIGLNDIRILVDGQDVTDVLEKKLENSDIMDEEDTEKQNGVKYTLTLSGFELDANLADEIFRRHSGKIELIISEGKVKDTSGNENRETHIIVDNDNGDDENNFINVDFIKPKLFYDGKFISWDKRYAEVTVKGTDRFYDFDTKLLPEDVKLYQQNNAGEYIEVTTLPITIKSVKNDYGYDFVIRLNEFEEEYKMKLVIAANKISDTSGNMNEETEIIVGLDNKKPIWKYISTDTSTFEEEGKISFTVKGQDKFLNLTKSGLQDSNLKVFRDGTDITADVGITVNYLGQDDTEKSKSYKIDVTNLTEIGTYSLVFEEKTLIDEFENESNTTTISFSKSVIASNTNNYTAVTYHASPDFEQTHRSYVHELMSVNKTGTNFENTTYRPSSIGEIYDDGKNTPFAEPFKYENGVQTAYSFKGWGVANENGHLIDANGTILSDETGATIYGLYDEIPETVTNLKAVWQKATVVFVSKGGDNANDGLSPETPVKDIETAYGKLNSSGAMKTNVIVIMDKIEWNSDTVLTGNATITSLYAGVDYRKENAELKISSNMQVKGNIMFDNIKLYSNSTTVSDGKNYLANGSYNNMLITNYGNVVLGRGISTPDGKYTFGAVIGGEYKQETIVGEIGIHAVIVEAGKYNNIVVGSAFTSGGQSTKVKYVSHQVTIGTMKDAAISRNDHLTITGYLSMGELEDQCYPYNNSSSQDTALGYSRNYAITKLYSGTFTGENKFAKASEDASIYLRSINGLNDGKTDFEMYGGDITGNVYAGARLRTTHEEETTNIMNFYGGNLTGNVFGHGGNDASIGGSEISIEGIFAITGNIFGGSNATTVGQGKVTGNTNITLNSTSSTITGNVYGGSNGIINDDSINTSNGLITGSSNVTLNAGKVTGDIYGGGNNCGITDIANITINNGQVTGTIYGGARQNQVRTTINVNLLGGTVNDVYGANILTSQAQLSSDSSLEDVNIVIGDNSLDSTPTIKGTVYGSGSYDRVGIATIQLVKAETTPTIYGGSKETGVTNETKIYLNGMTLNEIYGGSNGIGSVTTSRIYLQSGTVKDVYGAGYGGTVTTTYVSLRGVDDKKATATNIFGGPNNSGSAETSNVTLNSGTVTNVYGGGYNGEVRVANANVTLDGSTMNVSAIYGGSKNGGTTTETNVVIKQGSATDVYGGGQNKVLVTTANVTKQGGSVRNIFGGNNANGYDESEVVVANVNIVKTKARNVYGGGANGGFTMRTVVNISGESEISGDLYGGGYESNVGLDGNSGSTTMNIVGGIIDTNVNGGSKDGFVYGDTNVNVGSDASTVGSLVRAEIDINGNIYGAGDTYKAHTNLSEYDYNTVTVFGNTHITLDNSGNKIFFGENIYGAGNAGNYSTNNTANDESTVTIRNFGTSSTSYGMVSIQRTGKVYIDNSYLELTGIKDKANYYSNTSYTLNRVTNGLELQNSSTLFTRRAFNMVGGFSSVLAGENSTTKETVTIENDKVTRNVDNRLYTYEGVNLVFAKEEGNIYNKANQDIWGDVEGMAFFGMYRTNRVTSKKEFDIYAPNYTGGAVEGFFANGTYVEGRHKANHDTTVDGFYTNVGDYSDPNNITVVPEIIEVADYGTYYDWIAGGDVVNYSTSLIASTYSTYSMSELELDYKYMPNATYSVSRVSANALDETIQLIDPEEIPTISTNANSVLGLTMQTDTTGWTKAGKTIMLAGSDNYGSYTGDKIYKTDSTTTPGKLIFRVYNSINISENKDLGFVNVILMGKTRTGEDSTQGGVFRVIIAVNLQTLKEDRKDEYVPMFTDSTEKELNYTTDSRVDLTYVLYNDVTETIYANDDYRVISTTTRLPAGTKLTMKDYGQGDSVNKIYYYHVTSDTDYNSVETADGSTRYIYRLSKFIDMGSISTGAKYTDDNNKYYHNSYVFEKYNISIDLGDTNVNTEQLAQETYLELRNSSGTLKYSNGDKTIKYNLYNNNATFTESISNEANSYSIVEDLTIPFNFAGVLQEKITAAGAIIKDTKFYDKKVGMAIEIVNEAGARIKAPEVQNLKLVNSAGEEYIAGQNGVIRVPLSDGFAILNEEYKLSLTQYNVQAGKYSVKVYFFTSDDGLYYGEGTVFEKEFYITFINKLLGTVGLETNDKSRIINKTTGTNFNGSQGLEMSVKVNTPTSDINIRAELYKRNTTYELAEDGTITYTGTQYTKVDLKDILDGDWKTPEDYGLVTSEGATEYVIMPKDSSLVDEKTIEFNKEIKEGISTGEYKLVFKTYSENTLVQSIRKTFVVTE